MIDRIQDSEGVTIYNSEQRTCDDCEQITFDSSKVPKILDNFNQIFSPESAYQMTSMLEGVIKRGTGKGLRDLNLDIAGKTGTTNKNTDAWFIGFTSNLVIGVYVGHDNPKSLGKIETGSRAAMPIFKKFVKKAVKKNEFPDSYKDFLITANDKWADPTFWYAMGQMVNNQTPIYYYNAIDMTYDQDQNVIRQEENRRVYVQTWIKTLKVSVYVTFFCLVLGFPVAHLLANLPLRYSNLLMIFVLLPFWTSLLVRTTAWIVMLQQQGVINGILVWLGILNDDGRLSMVYNETGTLIAMTQILLPFMILPLYLSLIHI